MPMPTHTHGFWVGMGVMLLFMGGHGWASVLCIPASSSKSESNFSDAGNTLTKKRWVRAEASDSERPFICPIQPRLGVCGQYTLHNFLIHGHNLNSMGGHRSMLMVMVWVWVQIRRKMLGSALEPSHCSLATSRVLLDKGSSYCSCWCTIVGEFPS